MSAGTSWTFTPPVRDVERPRLGDRWLWGLGVVILGYALLGRGFAYIGVPPLFISEVLLLCGIGIVLFATRTPRLMPTLPLKVLAALMVWTVVRTIPYFGTYGIDAIRDAMIVGYGLFAFILAALLLDRPERLKVLVRRYSVLLYGVLVVGWVVYLAFRLRPDLFPTWPWAPDVAVVANKPGDLLVHLAGITAFLVLGGRTARPLTLLLLVLAVGAMMVGNRGGMLGFLCGMAVLTVLKPSRATFGRLAFVGAFVVVAALVVDTGTIKVNEGSRSLSVDQIWENVKSVFGKSDEYALNTTTEWRTLWWSQIFDYTFGGEYFVEGKGFGRNLATEDGFQVDENETLRSPHNSLMTILARGGVPAFVLWLLVHGLWLGYVGAAWWRARLARQAGWMSVFALLAVYWVAAQVNGSFDVYLEGPMGAILFWSVFGIGMAASVLQQTHPHLADDLFPAVEQAPSAPPAWGTLRGPRRDAPSAERPAFADASNSGR